MHPPPPAWSQTVQTIQTLYMSRNLRFREEYRAAFTYYMSLSDGMSILDIGCGPGLLCHRLGEWFPAGMITGIDRDRDFVMHAYQGVSGSDTFRFIQGEAISLPFSQNSFDAVISHTVIEHVDAGAFVAEQFRVCRPGGIISVISSRPEAAIHPGSQMHGSDVEISLWNRLRSDSSSRDGTYIRGRHPDVGKIPRLLEDAGFTTVTVNFLAITLSPDNDSVSIGEKEMYAATDRQMGLDFISLADRHNPGVWTRDEVSYLVTLVEERYASRMKQIRTGERIWDISAHMLMITTGKKPGSA